MSVRSPVATPGATFGGEGSRPGERMSFGGYEVPQNERPEAGFKEGYPQIKVSVDGVVTIAHAPDLATFSWYLLTSDDLDSNVIKREADTIAFFPTGEEPVRYKIIGYNCDTKRFQGQRIYE